MSNTNTSLKFGDGVLCAVFVVRLLSFLPQKVISSLTNGSEREETSISKLPLVSPAGYKSLPQNTMAPRWKPFTDKDGSFYFLASFHKIKLDEAREL